MQIKKYKKAQKNTYIVQIDNQEYKLYDDIIIKYSLLLKKEISSSELEEIKKENSYLDCYYQAVLYLNRKMRCSKEIKDYLKKKEFSEQDINNTISKLKTQKYLDEKAYINAYIHDTLLFNLDGPKQIRRNLEKLELDSSLITEELNSISKKVWQERCLKLVTKKIKTYRKESKEKIKQKVQQYALTKGYTKEEIGASLENITLKSDLTILKKEYEKLYQKLKLKYQEPELKYQILVRLKRKGYTTSEIESII